VDAARHINLKVFCIALAMRMDLSRFIFCRVYIDCLCRADDSTKLAADTAFFAIWPFGEVVAASRDNRKRSPLFGIANGNGLSKEVLSYYQQPSQHGKYFFHFIPI